MAFPIFVPLHQMDNFSRASFLAAAMIKVGEIGGFIVFLFFFGLVLVDSADCFEEEEEDSSMREESDVMTFETGETNPSLVQ